MSRKPRTVLTRAESAALWNALAAGREVYADLMLGEITKKVRTILANERINESHVQNHCHDLGLEYRKRVTRRDDETFQVWANEDRLVDHEERIARLEHNIDVLRTELHTLLVRLGDTPNKYLGVQNGAAP